MVKTGLVLTGLGLIALLLGTMKFKAKHEIFNVGGFGASTSSERTIPEVRYAGIGLIALGGLAVVVGWRKPGGR